MGSGGRNEKERGRVKENRHEENSLTNREKERENKNGNRKKERQAQKIIKWRKKQEKER